MLARCPIEVNSPLRALWQQLVALRGIHISLLFGLKAPETFRSLTSLSLSYHIHPGLGSGRSTYFHSVVACHHAHVASLENKLQAAAGSGSSWTTKPRRASCLVK